MLPEEQTFPYNDDAQWPREEDVLPAPDVAPPEGAQANEFSDEDNPDWPEYSQYEYEVRSKRVESLLKGHLGQAKELLQVQRKQAEEMSAEAGDTPHVFECGSEEELKQITVAIVQSDSELFAASQEVVKVIYRAKTPTKRAYMMKTMRGYLTYHDYADWDPFVSGRLQSLCDLAQRLNTFTGVTYEPDLDEPNLYAPNNRPIGKPGRLIKRVHKIEVVVSPPSRHEQAESLLMLNDWLKGKVSERRKPELLGLTQE